MRRTVLFMMSATLVAGLLSTSCKPSATKIGKAQDHVQTATHNLQDANKELTAALNDSIQLYKRESEIKISYYQKNIADLKVQLSKEKGVNKAKIERTLANLEKKSNEMKMTLADYTNDGQDKWNSFKKEFSHDLDELGNAFKDVTVNNIK